MIEEIISNLINNKISPNQYYLLICINNKTNPLMINIDMELRLLKPIWVTEDNKLTQKAIDFIEYINNTYTIKEKKQVKKILGDNFEENINIYRELFPKGKLPSGVAARVTIQELEKKFTWFFNTYKNKYSWDIIIEATKKYVESYESNNYMYMKNSAYFICKNSTSGGLVSDLANECELYLEQDDEPIVNSKIIRKKI